MGKIGRRGRWPYAAGNILHFDEAARIRHCEIIKPFYGKADIGFTNSCTLLVKLLGDLPSELEEHRIAVLKCLDPQRSNTIREEYQVTAKIWTEANHMETTSSQRRDQFRAKFFENPPRTVLESRTVRSMIEMDILPPSPQVGDIMLAGMSNTVVMSEFVRNGILEPVSPVQWMLAVKEFCHMLFQHEVRILRTVSACWSQTFPKLLEGVQVVRVTTSLDGESSKTMTIQAPALILEHIEGETLSQWATRNATALDQASTQDSSPSLLQDFRDICEGCVRSNTAAILCGIQPDDIRADNYLTSRNPTSGKMSICSLDAGGYSLVSHSHLHDQHADASDSPTTKCAEEAGRQSMQEHRFNHNYYTGTVDDNTLIMLEDLLLPFPHISRKIDWGRYRLDIFRQFEEPLDTLFWRTVCLGLCRFTRPTTTDETIENVIEVLRTAQLIMSTTKNEVEQDDSCHVHWGWVAVYRVGGGLCTGSPLSALSQIATGIYQMLITLEDGDIFDFASQYEKEPWLVENVLDHTWCFQHQLWQDQDGLPSDFRLWLDNRALRVCSEPSQVDLIDSVLREVQRERPSRLWDLRQVILPAKQEIHTCLGA